MFIKWGSRFEFWQSLLIYFGFVFCGHISAAYPGQPRRAAVGLLFAGLALMLSPVIGAVLGPIFNPGFSLRVRNYSTFIGLSVVVPIVLYLVGFWIG